MKTIFQLVYKFLMFLSNLTGFSYKEINIIIWFIIIPFSWTYLIDRLIKKHYLKYLLGTIFIVTLTIIDSFSNFSNTLFDESANFLKSFNSLGSSYVISSVIICVFAPIIIYIYLIRKNYFLSKKK